MFEMIMQCCTYRGNQKWLKNLQENLKEGPGHLGNWVIDRIIKIGCGDVIDLSHDMIQYQAIVNMVINQVP
jgi:hypothetical protein